MVEDNIQEMYRRVRRAFEEVGFWPQEKVDEMVAAVAWEWQKDENIKAVAKLAVEEGKIGVYEDKLSKIRRKTRGTMWDFRGAKTCGLVKEEGIHTYSRWNVLMIAPPLCINEEELMEGVEKIDKALTIVDRYISTA